MKSYMKISTAMFAIVAIITTAVFYNAETTYAKENIEKEVDHSLKFTKYLPKTGEKIKGDKLSIVLSSNASTGCSWSVQIENEKVLSYEKNIYFEYDQSDEPFPLCGMAGREKLVFRGLKKGVTDISLNYGHSWEEMADPYYQAVYRVKVGKNGKIKSVQDITDIINLKI